MPINIKKAGQRVAPTPIFGCMTLPYSRRMTVLVALKGATPIEKQYNIRAYVAR